MSEDRSTDYADYTDWEKETRGQRCPQITQKKSPWMVMGSGLAIIQNHANSLRWERHYG